MKERYWLRGVIALLLVFGLIVFGFVVFQAGMRYAVGIDGDIVPGAPGWNPLGTLLLIGMGFFFLIFLMKMVFGLIFMPFAGYHRMHGMHPGNFRFGHRWKGAWGEDPEKMIREWHERLHEEETPDTPVE